MCKHGASPLFMKVLLGRWRSVEEQLAEAHASYRRLVAAHNATLDRRIKNFIKNIFGLEKWRHNKECLFVFFDSKF